MKVVVLGTGYVGLVSGVCLAAKGHAVTCLDLRKEVVDQLNCRKPHIHEKGLPELLGRVISDGRFRAQLPHPSAFVDSEIILVAVGTPTTDGAIDLGAIQEAAREVGRYLRAPTRFCSVVVKSTVLPGTTDTVVRQLLEEESGRQLGVFGLGMNPEFLREGEAVEDFMLPDRIVLGYDDLRTKLALEALYAPWDCEKLSVNTRTAEMIKYANNCLLATQISAVNELANIAAAIGNIEIAQVMAGVHADKRWNPILPEGRRVNPGILAYLKPGCGFGGSCFPKDVQAMRSLAAKAGVQPELLAAVLSVNARQPAQVAAMLEQALGPLSGRRVLLLGLAFKPGTDDLRESASLRIARDLLIRGAQLQAHDPIAGTKAAEELHHDNFRLVEDWEAALAENDATVLATAWPEYDRLLVPENVSRLQARLLFDARGRFSRAAFPKSVRFMTIGFRPTADQYQLETF